MVARRPATSPTRGKTPDSSPTTAEPPRTELSAVDFSGAESSRLLSGDGGFIEVHDGGSGMGALYEEAAILYANGNAREAQSMLEASTNDVDVVAGIGLWMMLLDLYQLTGQRECFEAKVLDYARRFERSPPPWVDLSGSSPSPSRKGEAIPLINLSGKLCSQSSQQFQQLRLIGHRSGALRIDLRRVKSIDDDGCHLLTDMARFFARERVKFFMLNAAQLAGLLKSQVQTGVAEGQERWLTLLEVLQHTGDQEQFEELAIDYAVTFEESPPSWEGREPPLVVVPVAGKSRAPDNKSSSSGLVLEGELNSASSDSIRNLAASVHEGRSMDVDCSRLRRMDFVSAGILFNVLSTLHKQGKQVSLRNVNGMVAALWRVMGIDKVASVTLRH